MSYKKIEDMQYLYENLNSHDEELVELLEVLEGHLKESGYSDKAIECFIETADVYDVESHIQLSSLDEGAKTKLLKKLGTGAWNLIKGVGKKLKTSGSKGLEATKKVIKNNPKTSAVVGTSGLVGTALATSGDPKPKSDDNENKTDNNTIKLTDPGAYTPKTTDTKVEPPKVNTTDPKGDSGKRMPKPKNVPDGLARVVAGGLDAITGNMTDFDQRGGKPQGISRVVAGTADALTGNLTDLDKRGGKPTGLSRIVTGGIDKLTGDRTDFDQRGVSKLNYGQRQEQERIKREQEKNNQKDNKVEPPKIKDETPKDPPPVVDGPPPTEDDKTPKYTNPSGKPLPKPKDVRPGSARERMISKNIEIHGAENIKKLRTKNAAFQATKDKTSGYTKDDFIKDFPNSNTAKKHRQNRPYGKRQNHPDLNKVLGRESFDAFDIVLGYLQETQQADSLDEALYIMMEMNDSTIQGIVRDYEYLAEEEYDRRKDAENVRGGNRPGDGDNPSVGKPNYGRKQTEDEKKKSQANSKKAFDTVVNSLRAKYGNNAVVTNTHLKKAKKKKEEAQNK